MAGSGAVVQTSRDLALAFDINAIGPDFIENPHTVLGALRDHDPVHFNPDGSVFLTRYEDVKAVYQDRSMLSEKTREFALKYGRQSPLFLHHTTSLVFNDPPYHTVVRKLLAGAFTPRRLAEMEPLIGTIVDKLLDDLEARAEQDGEVDFLSAFAMRLPTEIISFMLGIPQEHRGRLRAFSLAILGALDPAISPEREAAGNAAVSEFSEILEDIIAFRRKHPETAGQGEVLDALIFGDHEGRSLNPVELVQNCIFLLNAGHETTTSLVSNAVGMFISHPDQYRRLAGNPDLIDTAVEEILRFESPLQIGNRRSSREVVLCGVRIPEGTYIHTSIASANRDEREFAEPDKVDFARNPNRHLAFITGIHVCLGATLARYEGRIALGRLAQRFPGLRAGDSPAQRMPLARFRGYNSLPVRV